MDQTEAVRMILPHAHSRTLTRSVISTERTHRAASTLVPHTGVPKVRARAHGAAGRRRRSRPRGQRGRRPRRHVPAPTAGDGPALPVTAGAWIRGVRLAQFSVQSACDCKCGSGVK